MIFINEVAWMGTPANANAEWVELANTDAAPRDLSGWILKAADGTPTIKLAGTIVGNGFFLLERTSDASLPDITADDIYTGALENGGETLTLSDASGAVVDQVPGATSWPAGDNDTKQTAQRTSSGTWITAPATPRAENANPAPKPAPKPSAKSTSSHIVQKVVPVTSKVSSPAYEATAVAAPAAPTNVGAAGAALHASSPMIGVLTSPWALGFLGVLLFSGVALVLL